MKKIVLLLPLLFFISNFAQLSPPLPSIPKANHEKLIDEFIRVSNYKETVINYSRVYFWSQQYNNGKRNYGNEEIDEILNKFDFETFKKTSLYNSFSLISESKLKSLIEFYKTNGGKIDDKNNIIIISASISSNLQNELNKEMEALLIEKKIK
ncbi:MAG: hypothetical protein K0M56_05530 [Kaistella sp.]|nr:hypothetical protein [Kaistella sp.]